ncbi:uncharacterized protein YALI1_F17491g [Yarrowia lipolytica]|jgi:peptidyl-tRNA hydrolase ICT1|nr:hypothetical protein YALI1_F17491g [Yarrowia lipolytica]
MISTNTMLRLLKQQVRHQTTLADVQWLKSVSASQIPRQGFTYRFDKSSGPGGQHVNKTNTKATLKMDAKTLRSSTWIPQAVKTQIYKGGSNFPFLTLDQSLLVQSDRFRSQTQNVEDCFERLAVALRQIRLPDRPHSQESIDKWDKIAKKEDKKRLAAKKRLSQKKEGRRAKGEF